METFYHIYFRKSITEAGFQRIRRRIIEEMNENGLAAFLFLPSDITLSGATAICKEIEGMDELQI